MRVAHNSILKNSKFKNEETNPIIHRASPLYGEVAMD